MAENPATGEDGVLYVKAGEDGSDEYYYWGEDDQGVPGLIKTNDVWNGQFGVYGEFDVEFSGLDTETPKATITPKKSCYAMSQLPDTRLGVDVVDVLEYSIPDQEIDVSFEDI